MSQLARRENAPHRAAFVTSPVSYTHLDVYKRQERGGTIQCAASNNSQDYATVHCEGETDDFLYLGNTNFNNVGGAYYLTIFAVEAAKAVTGRRFRLVTGSICSTGGKGPVFFPGDTAGTLEESKYCVYK